MYFRNHVHTVYTNNNTFVPFRKLRGGVHRQLLINLCVALTGLYATFIISTFSMAVWQWCIVISALMQYFFLATFFWMTAEAIHLFRKLVQALKPDLKNYVAIAMTLCWGKSVAVKKYFYIYSICHCFILLCLYI